MTTKRAKVPTLQGLHDAATRLWGEGSVMEVTLKMGGMDGPFYATVERYGGFRRVEVVAASEANAKRGLFGALTAMHGEVDENE